MRKKVEEHYKKICFANIKILRLKRKLTQFQMAELLKCSPRNYHRIESGELWLSVPQAIIISAAFDVTIDELIKVKILKN